MRRKKRKKKNKKNRNNVEKGGRQYSATGTYNEVTGGGRKSSDKESMDHRCLTAKPRSIEAES